MPQPVPPRSRSSYNTSHRQRRRFEALLVLCFILAFVPTLVRAEPSSSDVVFESHVISTGSAENQTVLSGFLLDRTVMDLAVVNSDGSGKNHLRIFAFDDAQWKQTLSSLLGDDVLFVDVANIAGRDRLITVSRRAIRWFDPGSKTEQLLLEVKPDVPSPDKGVIPNVDVFRDVTGDGRDDLVLPDRNGFRISVQSADGHFAETVRLGPSFDMDRLYEGDGTRHDPWTKSRIHVVDWDRNGRDDLVYWKEDHFEAHLQNERGLFIAEPETFVTSIEFDSDDSAYLVAPDGVRQRRRDHHPAGELTGRVLYSLGDENGDGIADLVLFSLQGGSLFRMHSLWEVHWGKAIPDGTEFSSEAGTSIAADGIPFSVETYDVDRDGRNEVLFTTITPGFFKAIGMIVGAVFTGGVSLDLDVYRMKSDLYSVKPAFNRKVKSVTAKDSGGRTYFPPLLVGDVNGDGLADLLAGKSGGRLLLFEGIKGRNAFASRPQTIVNELPAAEELLWLVDVNRDGREDLLMHYPSAHGSDQIRVLIAR